MTTFEICTKVLVIFISVLFFISKSDKSLTESIQEDESLETIKFPENTIYKARIFASYPSKEVLKKAKFLVDKNFPFHGAPHGGTYYIAKRREYYLNQYLWFYEKYKRLPKNNELVIEKYCSSNPKNLELKPATWFTLIDKNELRVKKLFLNRTHLWISLKNSSHNNFRKLRARCDQVDEQITELFTKDPDSSSRLSKGVNHDN